MEDIFNFKHILAKWQEETKGSKPELAFKLYKEKYYGDSKYANHHFIQGSVYSCTRLLKHDEKGVVNPRPLFLSLGPKKQEGPRHEVVIDLCRIPYKTRPLLFAMLYKYYGKKLMLIQEKLKSDLVNKVAIQLSSKEAAMIFKGIIPVSSIVSVPREALVKIHPVEMADWTYLCYMDTKGLGPLLQSVFAQFKQALENEIRYR